MRVTSKRQVTIPQEIRELADITPGSNVEFHFENGRIWLPKSNPRARARKIRARLERLRRSATANLDLTTDEWMRMTRGVD